MQQLLRSRTHVAEGEHRRSASRQVDIETQQCDTCHSAGQWTSRETGDTRRTVERYILYYFYYIMYVLLNGVLAPQSSFYYYMFIITVNCQAT